MVRRKILHLAVILSMMLTMVGVVMPTAVGAQSLTINPPSVNFDTYKVPAGGQQLNTQSQPVVITITNTDPGPITITGPITVTTGASDFAVTGNGCLIGDPLSNGQQCQFSVVFKPTGALVAKNGQVTIPTSGGPSFVSLSGTATSPFITISPLVLNFGAQQVNTTSPVARTVTITNTGDGPVTINFFTVTNDPANAYDVIGDTCSPGGVIGPQQSCTVSVVFNPPSVGSFDGAQLNFNTTAAGSPLNATVILNGTGVNPSGTLTPSSANFGAVLVDTFSAPQVFTVTNTGTGPLPIIGNPNLAGDNPGQFQVLNNQCVAGTQLPVNGTCTFQVAFRPTSNGVKTATVNIPGLPGPNQVAVLNGTGVTGKLQADTINLNFGSQQVLTASDPQTVTITNVSGETVTITDFDLSDLANYEVVADGCSPATLLPGQSCQISVRFIPTTTGPLSAILSVEHTGNGGQNTTTELDIALNGTGITPVLVIAPSVVNFGAQQLNTLSGPQTVTITNSTNGPLAIGPVDLIGAGTQFFIINNQCANVTLAAGANCKFDVTFLPQNLGEQTDTVRIRLQDPTQGGPYLVQLKGTGVTAVLGVSPNNLQFGNQVINTTSSPQTVTVTNLGSGPISLGAISIGGTDAGNYEVISDLCSNALLPNLNSSCTFNVRFRPTTPGAKGSAYVIIPSNAGGSPVNVALNGFGVSNVNNLTFTPSPFNFGPTAIGLNSQSQVFTLTYNGPVTVQVTGATQRSGPNAADFVIISDGCANALLNTGGTCQVVVRFSPQAGPLGPRSAGLFVTVNGNVVLAELQGTATAAPASILTLTPNPHNFGAVPINQGSQPQVFTLANTGQTVLGPLAAAFTTGPDGPFFQIISDGCAGDTLNPGETCQIIVRFTPGAGRLFSSSLAVANPSGGFAIASIFGTGVTATLTVSPNNLQFGNQVINTTSGVQTVILTNSSNGSVNIGQLSTGGADGLNYEVVTDLCSNSSLAAGQSCTFTVRFRPTTPGSKGNAYVLIPAPVNGQPIFLALNGTGITASTQVSPTQLVFGPQPLNTVSGPQTVTFTNTSGGPVNIGAVGATGEFQVVGNFCGGGTLAAGANCKIDVVFAPTNTPLGPKNGQLIIPISVGPGEIRVSLTGTAIAPPQASVTISPLSHDFGTKQLLSPTEPFPFRLTNNGTLPVTVTSVVLGPLSPDPLDFILVFGNNCTGAVLNPGQFCEVAARFRPLGPGTGYRTAHLEFNTDAPGSPHRAYLIGTAITPVVTINQSQLNFGNQQLGTSSAPKTITLQNSTNGPLEIDTTAIVGEFVIVNDQCVGKTLASGATCTLDVIFKPVTAGPLGGSVTITIDGVGGPYVVDLYGVGITVTGSVSPLQLNFAAQQAGTTSLPQTVTFTNGPGGPITLPPLVVSGEYLIQTDGCSNATLPANGSCTFSVVFKPVTPGYKNGDVTVGPLANPTVITLTGTGVTSAILLAPQSLNFGNQQVGVQSNPQTITLVNTSGGPVSVTSVTLVGTNPADYILSNDNCTGAVLAQGGSCTVAVSFKPADQGSRTAAVRFTDSAAGSPHDVPVLGNGVFPVPVFQASAVDFGNQVINTTSVAQTVKVTNNGPGTMLINSVTITGANAADFSIFFNNGCAGALAPGASCEVQVKFRPTALGARTAFLTFATNVAGSPNNVLLTGNGVPVPSFTVTVNTVGAGCTAAIAPAGPYQATDEVTLTAGFNPATTVFIGWTLDGNFVGFANPLKFTVGASSHNVLATCVPRPSFSDVNGATPYNDAIIQMAARGFIKGYGDGTFGPNDGILRAQMAGITVRLAGWSSLVKPNIFTDRCNAGGCIDDELWNSVAVTAFFQVARGYEDNTYRPFDPVANIQAVAFITRTMVKLGYWQFQPDNPAIYPNVLTGTGHRADISTYYFYAGAVPGTNAANAWPQWDQPSTRAYFAGIYWQAYASYFGVDRVP